MLLVRFILFQVTARREVYHPPRGTATEMAPLALQRAGSRAAAAPARSDGRERLPGRVRRARAVVRGRARPLLAALDDTHSSALPPRTQNHRRSRRALSTQALFGW